MVALQIHRKNQTMQVELESGYPPQVATRDDNTRTEKISWILISRDVCRDAAFSLAC